jgi:hypothetical protein
MLLELTSSGRIPKGVDSQEEMNTILIAVSIVSVHIQFIASTKLNYTIYTRRGAKFNYRMPF